MMLEDVYVAITATEKANPISDFIDKYLRDFQEEVDYYEYPPYFGETEFETRDFNEMLSFVLEGGNRSFRFYFENPANVETPKGMIFVNSDGSVFLGLGVHPDYSVKYEHALRNDFHSSLILICNETLVPDNLREFKSLV